MKCSSTPILLNPPSCCHLLPRRQATASHLHIITISSSFTTPSIPALASSAPPPPRRAASSSTKTLSHRTHAKPEEQEEMLSTALPSPTASSSSDGYFSAWAAAAAAAAAVGVAVAVLLVDAKEAMALGPEGPLVEEFWDNMRRYGLYVLTVSTGAIYTVLQPIVELLKNPISAVLILVILGGGFYLLSQVLSLMVGINDFAYDYAN